MRPAANRNEGSLAEERRGTRQIMMWGAGAAVVLFAVFLVWAMLVLPQGYFPTGTRQPSSATGTLANQGAGQSTAAKNGSIIPEANPTGGGGQSSNGNAAQINQSASPLKLTEEQRRQITAYFADKGGNRVDTADFALSVGAAVPQQTQLQELPPQLTSAMGGFAGNQYVLVRNQLVIVDPSARRVVAIVPDIGANPTSG